MNSFTNVINWTPCEDLIKNCKNLDYAIIILNTPINFNSNQQFIINLWNQAKVRVTVDGGTKKWVDWLTANECEFDNILNPNLITGDMDSLPEEVLNYFRNDYTKIVTTPDQNETDYTKALQELNKYCNAENIEIKTIYVLVDTCGRFDQIMANINTLYKSTAIIQNVQLFQIAASSITWLLQRGRHSISIPVNLRSNQEWCSLIPIGKPCVITSTGLKWNIGKIQMHVIC
ncbi:hypothetical protein NQ317_017846 [Molorchus minor]|uniref:Thiamine diphosphokinase n=1 Tax=Molorchus minor TaxID=1323400 RepID=A0ABQ9K060_9CUCU|nr:hypothetical protein NQ317_017846 [Molorchus minor]